MTQRKANSLTITLFKEQLEPRSFEVPFSWLTQLGAWIGVGLVTLIAFGGSTAYYYHIAKSRGALKSNDLEKEILALQNEKTALEARLKNTNQSSSTPVNKTGPLSADHPFANLSVFWDGTFPPLDQVPVKLSKPQWSVQSGKLRVQFFIQYIKEDGGSQQGKFMLLARGSDVMMSHPSDLLNLSDGHTLIDLDQAETFSVSRIREVKAEFEVSRAKTRIKEIHVLIFDSNDRPLLQDRLIPPQSIPQTVQPATPIEDQESSTPTAPEKTIEEKSSEPPTS